MLKHLSICVALVALGTSPLCAQEQDARTGIDLGSADAMVVHLMTPEEFEKFGDQRRQAGRNPAAALPDLGSPDAMVVHLMTPEEFRRFEDQRRPALAANPDGATEMTRAQASLNRVQ
jgi:hypothetical protein